MASVRDLIVCGIVEGSCEIGVSRRREELVAKPEYVAQVIAEGAERARRKTAETMELVWRAMKLR